VLHCDEDELTAAALDRPVSDIARRHLEFCDRCRREVATLSDVVRIVRDSTPVAPPTAVWDRIAAATGVTAAPRPSEVLANAELPPDLHLPAEFRAPAPSPAAVRAASAPPLTSPGPAGDDPVMVQLRRPRASRRRTWPALSAPLLAVAAAFGLVGALIGGTAIWFLRGDPASDTGGQVVVGTALAGLPAARDATGHAEVLQVADGERRLAVDVTRLGPTDGFYEVWLIDPTVTKMVPVGVLDGARGEFAIPSGVNLSAYPVVDVSVEKVDGDPRHSGDSVLRGTLPKGRVSS
jgi:hypothetical protein